MEEGLQGLLMGVSLVMFLIAMQLATQAVSSSLALEETAEKRMLEQRTVTLENVSQREDDVSEWMKYLEE